MSWRKFGIRKNNKNGDKSWVSSSYYQGVDAISRALNELGVGKPLTEEQQQ